MSITTYCPKCGAKADEDMAFCPKCGASLKAERRRESEERRREKTEKHEKEEKQEKHEKPEKNEKREKREFNFLGSIIGGLALIFLGLMFYMEVTGTHLARFMWAAFLVIVGVLIIIGVAYASTVAKRRYPKT